MLKEKQIVIDYLKGGKQLYTRIYYHLKKFSDESALAVRDSLLSDGYIQEDGFYIRPDGKKINYYKLTKKKFVQPERKKNSFQWEDGTFKSRGNAFDWENFSKGIYSPGELAASEAGRKFGIMSASRKILPRVTL